MIKVQLLYTGADNVGLPQLTASKSIGGFVSSSQVPNLLMQNLFGDVSYQNLVNGSKTLRALALKFIETTGNFRIGILPNSNDLKFKIELAFVSVTNNQMEKLLNDNAEPIYAQFNEHSVMSDINDVSNMFYLADQPKDTVMGVWIKRTILKENQLPTSEIPICQQYEQKENIDDISDGFKIIVQYDD